MKVERVTQVVLITFDPAIAKPMLYAVLFCSMSCKYVGVAEGNLFFFGGGERGEGKALLQTWVLVRVERSANVLFPVRLVCSSYFLR